MFYFVDSSVHKVCVLFVQNIFKVIRNLKMGKKKKFSIKCQIQLILGLKKYSNTAKKG